MIRLEPARIESERGNWGRLSGGQLQSRAF